MKNRLLFCAGLLIAAGTVPAQGIDYEARVGVSYSDNIERAPKGSERSTSAALAGVVLRGQRPEGRLRYDVGADVSYYEYLSLDIDSEVMGRARLQGSYDLIPENFTWNAGFSYDQIRGDILRPLAPGNLEDEVTFSTGPTLTARFSNTLEAELEGQYSHTGYSKRPFDSETVGGRALLVRRANPRSLLALGGSYDDVSYTSGSSPSGLDFDRREGFARMELEGVRTQLQLEVGYAKVSGLLVDGDGVLVRTQISRRITPSLTLFVAGQREYPTAQGGLVPTINAPGTVGGGADSSLLTSGPRQQTNFQGGLRLERTRSDAEIVYTAQKEQSLLAGIGSRRYDELRGRLGRRFTPGVRGSFYSAFSKEDYSVFTQDFEDVLVGAQLDMSIGRALGIGLYVEHHNRDGDTAAYKYSELTGGIYLRYRGSTGRTPQNNPGTR